MTKSLARNGEQVLIGFVRRNRRGLAVAALFVVVTAVHLFTLMRFPPVFVDEGWQANRAWALIHTGRAFGSLDPSVMERFEGYWTYYPWLPSLLQSLSLRVVGSPDLFSMRMTSLVFGLLLLGAVYAIAQRLYGWKFGLLGAFLVSVSWPFSNSAHMARVDIMAAACGFAAIALHLHACPPRWWMHLLSGLCVGLAFEIHPHGAIYGAAIVALYFLQSRWAVFREPGFWSFVGGAGVGLAFYAALHILPYPQTYWTVNRLIFGPWYTPPILQPALIVPSIIDMGRLLFFLYPLLVPLMIWAIVALLRERTREAATPVVLSGVLIGVSILLMRSKMHYSAILFTPAVDLMVAALIFTISQRLWRGLPLEYVRRVLVWGVALGAVIVNLFLLFQYDSWEAYQAAERRVVDAVQPGDSIMAPQTYWFGLYDHVYYSWQELVWYRRYDPDMALEDVLRRLQPDMLIIDDSWRYFISDQAGEDERYSNLRISKAEMEAFLSARASLVTEFDGGYLGSVRLYRITWDER